jgi:hypothetical protein
VAYSTPIDPEEAEPLGYYLYGGHEAGIAWYPDLVRGANRRERFRDFDVVLTRPDSLTVLTSGREAAPPRTHGRQITQRFEASRLEGFALAFQRGYSLTTVIRGEARVVAFTTRGLASTYREAAEAALDAVTWYRDTYGLFPVQQIGILQGHPQWSGGFPLPNLFMVHQGDLTSAFLRFITAHELGHYHWGLLVLGETERLDWLQLSLGIWGDQLYLAERSGRSLETQWRSAGKGDWYVDYFRSFLGNHEQTVGLTEAEASNLEFDYNPQVRHAKAAVGLYLQARRLGTERFLELERRILAEYRDRPLPVDAFLDRLEQAGAERSRDWLRAWMRGDGMLAYAADVTGVRRTTEGWTYTSR